MSNLGELMQKAEEAARPVAANVAELTVASISAEALVKRAVMNAKPRTCGDSPRWVAVMDTFALGSTYATQLCRAHGLDPDAVVSGPRCVACNP